MFEIITIEFDSDDSIKCFKDSVLSIIILELSLTALLVPICSITFEGHFSEEVYEICHVFNSGTRK